MKFFPQLLRFLYQAPGNDLRTSGYIKEYKDATVQASFGQGNKARVPWIAFTHEGQKVSNGIYPVFLYYPKYSCLILAYGISDTEPPQLCWQFQHQTQRREEVIDVKKYAYRYGSSYVFKIYPLDPAVENFGLQEDKIEEDIDIILQEYRLTLAGYKIEGIATEFDKLDLKIESEIGREGAPLVVTSVAAERNKKLRAKALSYHGTKCKACGFEFEEVYGEYGKDFIEIHHSCPLRGKGVLQERYTNFKTDLVPVCSNCHRIIHRRRNEVLSLDKLRSIINVNFIQY